MNVAPTTVEELDGVSLADSVQIIRSAFGRVAGELGITYENAPRFPSFITIERLEEMRAGGAVFFAAFSNGRQVGVVALEKEDTGEYYMKRLAVLPEYWHGGLGRRLVERAIDYARRLGIKKLHLAMVNEQAGLKEWYRGMGFRETAVKKYEHLPFSVCFMEMDIV